MRSLHLYVLSMAVLAVTYGDFVFAQQTVRQHESHVHGSAQLNIALEGGQLAIELISPAINIVGFEHQPGNEDQEKAVADAIAALQDGSGIFGFPAGAGCRLAKAEVEAAMQDEKHEKHEERAEEKGETHSEFHVTYAFECAEADKLSHIDLVLFETFPATEDLHVQVIGPNGQTSAELTPAMPRLSL